MQDLKKMSALKMVLQEMLGEMEHSPDELSELVGKKKPMEKGLTIMKVEGGELPEDELEMGEDEMFADDAPYSEEDSAESLKQRLAKLRG